MECAETPSIRAWLDRNIGANGPIHAAHFIDVRESMHNGGGPACLRLRVLMSAEAERSVNPAHLLDERTADRLEVLIATHWPERLTPADIGLPQTWEAVWEARTRLVTLVEEELA